MFSFRGGYDEQGNIEALFKDPVEWSDDDTRLKDPTIAVDVNTWSLWIPEVLIAVLDFSTYKYPEVP